MLTEFELVAPFYILQNVVPLAPRRRLHLHHLQTIQLGIYKYSTNWHFAGSPYYYYKRNNFLNSL